MSREEWAASLDSELHSTLDDYCAAETAAVRATIRMRRAERIGDAIEACLPAVALVVAALVLLAVVRP